MYKHFSVCVLKMSEAIPNVSTLSIEITPPETSVTEGRRSDKDVFKNVNCKSFYWGICKIYLIHTHRNF